MALPNRLAIVVVLTGALLCAPARAGAQARNDNQSAATDISALPVHVAGTLEGATSEPNEPANCASSSDDSVWYRLESSADQRIAMRLSVTRDTAALAIFRAQAAGLQQVTCDAASGTQAAQLGFSARARTSYLVRVSRPAGSDATTFALDAGVPEAAPKPPGSAIPVHGASDQVDALLDEADAWRMRLREGVTYRVNLAHPVKRCVTLDVFGPGATGFSRDAAIRRACGGYLLLTPGPGRTGRWSFVVRGRDDRAGATRYRLTVARAGPDDLTPGRVLHGRASGRLEGGRIDTEDVFRMDVTRRAHVVLTLRTASGNGFNLRLVNNRGRTIRCACGKTGTVQVRKGLRRGRYYVVVRARHRAHGTYSLARVARTITATRLTINGSRRARVGANATVHLDIRVHPGAPSGQVSVFVERLDPLSGWHFYRSWRLSVHGGHATLAFRLPADATWRAQAVYRGTRQASPSQSKHAYVRVVTPLRD